MQIGFEIWTMQNDILFDNIYIGHSVEDAEKLRAETFDIKLANEKAAEDAAKPKKEEKPKSVDELVFMEEPVKYVQQKVDLFVSIAKQDPVEAIKLVPEVAGGLGVVMVTLLAIIIGAIGLSSPAPADAKKAAEKVKTAAVDAKDKAVDAATTGAEKVQAEVNKRTTRSSAAAE